MTVSSTANRFAYAGDGTSTAFSFPYFFIQAADLLVTTTDSLGNITTQILTTNYTVTGTQAANGTYPNGGTVTFGVAPAAGITVSIIRVPDNKQSTHWVDGDPDPAAVKELAFDKLTIEVQRLTDLMSRAVGLPDGAVIGSFNPQIPYPLVLGGTLTAKLDGTGWALAAPSAAVTLPYTAPANAIASPITVQAAIDEVMPRIYGTESAPQSVASAISFPAVTGVAEQVWFIKGSGGPVDLSAQNPQIIAGTQVGQRLELHGCDDTNTVTFGNGNGIVTNGTRVLRNGTVLAFRWGGATWRETDFNNL